MEKLLVARPWNVDHRSGDSGQCGGRTPVTVLDRLEQQFLAVAQNDLMARIASGEIDTEAKRKKLLDQYGEELRVLYPEWANLQVSVVAGAGFHLNLRCSKPADPLLMLLDAENRMGLFRSAA